eukprot:3416274-Prymnesium_polylepis.1
MASSRCSGPSPLEHSLPGRGGVRVKATGKGTTWVCSLSRREHHSRRRRSPRHCRARRTSAGAACTCRLRPR